MTGNEINALDAQAINIIISTNRTVRLCEYLMLYLIDQYLSSAIKHKCMHDDVHKSMSNVTKK